MLSRGLAWLASAAAVGNVLTSPAIDSPGAAEFWWSHALISDEVFHGALDNCNFSSLWPLVSQLAAGLVSLFRTRGLASPGVCQLCSHCGLFPTGL